MRRPWPAPGKATWTGCAARARWSMRCGSPQEPAVVILGIATVGRLGRLPSTGTQDKGRGGQDENERIHPGTLSPRPMKGRARDTNDGLVRADPDRPASFF